MHVTISSPIPLPTPAAAAPDTDSVASVAASHLDDVTNRPRLAQRAVAFAEGLLQRVRSGFSSMLHRVGNLFADCLPNKKTTLAPASPVPSWQAEILAAGANSLLRAIPTMTSVLESPDPPGEAGDRFAAAFRLLGVGLRALDNVARDGARQGTTPIAVVDWISALIDPAIVANGQTEGELATRLNQGDNAFLADPWVQTELHLYFDSARDAASAVAAHAGEPELAMKLDTLSRDQREVP